MTNDNVKLCIFCRRLEPAGERCSTNVFTQGVFHDPKSALVSLSKEDEKIIKDLQQKPSILCDRCSAFDVRGVFAEADYQDSIRTLAWKPAEWANHHEDRTKHSMGLGKLSDLHLTASCQLCRLLYCIMPRRGLDVDNPIYFLKPFPQYIQNDGWGEVPEDAKSSFLCLCIGASSSFLSSRPK